MRSLSPTAFSFTLAQAFSNFLLTLSPTAFLCTLVYIVSHNVYARSCILCPTAFSSTLSSHDDADDDDDHDDDDDDDDVDDDMLFVWRSARRLPQTDMAELQ